MKKVRGIMWLILLCAVLCACGDRFDKIDASQVVNISIWYLIPDQQYELPPDDLVEFLELYNESEYAGKETGKFGTTPIYGAFIDLKNGDRIEVYAIKETGIDFHVEIEPDKHFYLNSEDLLCFLEAQMENISQ